MTLHPPNPLLALSRWARAWSLGCHYLTALSRHLELRVGSLDASLSPQMVKGDLLENVPKGEKTSKTVDFLQGLLCS